MSIKSFVMMLGIVVFTAVPQSASARVELSFAAHWAPGQPEHEVLLRYIDEYNAMQSDVTISYRQSAGFASDVDEQFLLASAAGLAPDIVHVPSGSLMQYGNKLGLLVPPPPELVRKFESVFLPGALHLTTVGTITYGPLTENQMHAMTLNGVVLDESGVAPTRPYTWDELKEMGRKLHRISPDGLRNIAGIDLVHSRAILSMAWSNGAEILSDDGRSFTLTGNAWSQTVLFLADLVASGTAEITDGRIFDANQAGIKLGSAPWMRRNYIPKSGEAAYARLITVPIPAGSTGRPASEHYGYALTVTTSSEHPAEAWDFIDWLVTAETPQGTTRMGDVTATLGGVPATYADLQNQPFRSEPYLFGFAEILTSNITRNIIDIPPIGLDVRNTIAAKILPVLNGTTSVQSGLIELQRVLQIALEN